MSDREKFEDFIKAIDKHDNWNLEKNKDGKYIYSDVIFCYALWQASRNAVSDESVNRINALEDALKPFARFACSPKGECDCHNCKARDLLDVSKQTNKQF